MRTILQHGVLSAAWWNLDCVVGHAEPTKAVASALTRDARSPSHQDMRDPHFRTNTGGKNTAILIAEKKKKHAGIRCHQRGQFCFRE